MSERSPVALIITLGVACAAVVAGTVIRLPAGVPAGGTVVNSRLDAATTRTAIGRDRSATTTQATPNVTSATSSATSPNAMRTSSASSAATPDAGQRSGASASAGVTGTPQPAPASTVTTTPTTATTGGTATPAVPAAQTTADCVTVSDANQYSACGADGSMACLTYQTPAPLFGTLTGWRCSVEVGAGASLAVYTVQHSCAGLAQAMTCRQETISQARVLLAADGCPAPIRGTIGGIGNRIPLTVRMVGPAGTRTIAAILDTGGVDTQLPNADMLAVGLTPTTETTAFWPLVSSAPVKEGTYTASYPEVYDNGAWVPLGWGTMTIHGADVPAGVSPLIGPDVLKAGTALSTDGSAFTLTPPCPPHGTE